MNIHSESTTTITLTITREEAGRIFHDFDTSKEPSTPSKRLLSSLARAMRGEPTVDQEFRERMAARPTIKNGD